jgi:hypothetical protein
MSTRTILAITAIIALGVPAFTAGQKPEPILEIFEVPGFSITEVHGIGPGRSLSGRYNAPGLGSHGFIYDGKDLRTLDVPGLGTFYVRLSPTGDAVAIAGAPGAVRSGFVYLHSKGEFRPIDVPPGTANPTPWGINARQDIVGSYTAPTPRAFLLRNGVFTDIHVPGAVTSAALDINSAGDIVGRSQETDARRMFLRTSAGTYHPIEVPGAASTGLVGFPGGINDHGEIVGVYQDGDSLKVKGFLLDANGFHTIDWPNTDMVAASDIDNKGNIVGSLRITGSGKTSGFLLRR